MDAPMMVTRRDVVLGARAWQPAWHKWMFKATLRSTDRKSVILTLQKYNFWSLASHKIITNGSYKKDSGLQCPLITYQKMQLRLILSWNTENRRNLACVFDDQRGHFKNHNQDSLQKHPFPHALRRWGRFAAAKSKEKRMFSQATIKRVHWQTRPQKVYTGLP